MADNTNASQPVEGENQNTSDESLENKDIINREEVEALKARHDAANFKARKLEKELSDIKKQLGDHSKETAAKEGDINKLRAEYAKDLEAKDNEVKTLNSKLKDAVVKTQFFAKAQEHFIPKSFDAVWKLLENEFDIQEENGQSKVIVKNSALDFDSYLKKFATENEYFAKAQGVGGTGTIAPNKGNLPNQMSREEFHKMDRKAQQEWAIKNPESIKKLLSS